MYRKRQKQMHGLSRFRGRKRAKYRSYGEYPHRYSNLLNKNFRTEKPNQKWVTNISHIHTKQGIPYLSVIRDLYDHSIVVYRTGTKQNINLVLSTIHAAKRKEKVAAELQLHSDQGFQYISKPASSPNTIIQQHTINVKERESI